MAIVDVWRWSAEIQRFLSCILPQIAYLFKYKKKYFTDTLGFSSNSHIKLTVLDHIYFVAQNVKLTLTWGSKELGLKISLLDKMTKENKVKIERNGDNRT